MRSTRSLNRYDEEAEKKKKRDMMRAHQRQHRSMPEIPQLEASRGEISSYFIPGITGRARCLQDDPVTPQETGHLIQPEVTPKTTTKKKLSVESLPTTQEEATPKRKAPRPISRESQSLTVVQVDTCSSPRALRPVSTRSSRTPATPEALTGSAPSTQDASNYSKLRPETREKLLKTLESVNACKEAMIAPRRASCSMLETGSASSSVESVQEHWKEYRKHDLDESRSSIGSASRLFSLEQELKSIQALLDARRTTELSPVLAEPVRFKRPNLMDAPTKSQQTFMSTIDTISPSSLAAVALGKGKRRSSTGA